MVYFPIQKILSVKKNIDFKKTDILPKSLIFCDMSCNSHSKYNLPNWFEVILGTYRRHGLHY